ncbi:hypothetical protein IWQ62_001452 [Dispira parvispora]|uniref:CN hydrolase domain-containing protein n=1 Tax=Dispira parvispora TaxID=1520584 RepID=A0A9W8ASB4_9FUNG|nr:hypothetical protein IWQ62_001452 [Dispira parvispora]
MRIAIAQYKIQVGQPDLNRRMVREQVLAELQGKAVDMVVFPELAFTGIFENGLADAERLAENFVTSPTVFWAQDLANKLKAHIVVGFPERYTDRNGDGLAYYNSACFITKDGCPIVLYRKTKLTDSDVTWATPGNGFDSYDIPFLGSVGLAIGTDLCESQNTIQAKSPSLADCELAYFHHRAGTKLIICLTGWHRGLAAEIVEPVLDNETLQLSHTSSNNNHTDILARPGDGIEGLLTDHDQMVPTVQVSSPKPVQTVTIDQESDEIITDTDGFAKPTEKPLKPGGNSTLTQHGTDQTLASKVVVEEEEEEYVSEDEALFMYWMYCLQPLFTPVHVLNPEFHTLPKYNNGKSNSKPLTPADTLQQCTTTKPAATTGIVIHSVQQDETFVDPQACHVIICNRVGIDQTCTSSDSRQYLGGSAHFSLRSPLTKILPRKVKSHSAKVSAMADLFQTSVQPNTYSRFTGTEGCFLVTV